MDPTGLGASNLGDASRRGGARRAAPGRRDPAVSRARRLGAVVTGAVALFALVACASSEGTVVAKTDEGYYDYGCYAGGTVTSPVSAPAWGSCSVPRCWRLVVRDSEGNTFEPCVSREEYDRTRLGAFWHGRTDQ